VQTYRRAWRVATRALLVVGGVVPLLVWCVASPWTFAAALAVACCAPRPAVPHFLDVRRWQLLRLLPAFVLAAVGWSMLLGAAGAALLLVDAAFGLPILAGDRRDRWPDGQHLSRIPDTIEDLAPASTTESAAAPSTTAITAPEPWPGPRTLLPDLDDNELLHAWESSTRALGLRPGPEALLGIVTARARYLDALDERDPDGLARRLAMGERDLWTSFDSPA
jgi:hypothetical protein